MPGHHAVPPQGWLALAAGLRRPRQGVHFRSHQLIACICRHRGCVLSCKVRGALFCYAQPSILQRFGLCTIRGCCRKNICRPRRQVYRAVRKGVQDAAVKLLINVDTAQLAVFSRVQLLFALM